MPDRERACKMNCKNGEVRPEVLPPRLGGEDFHRTQSLNISGHLVICSNHVLISRDLTLSVASHVTPSHDY